MGDHFVLLVDRLLTESTLEAAIESRNRLAQGPESREDDIALEKASNGLQIEEDLFPSMLVECRICQDEDLDVNMEAPCSCSGSLKYAHRRCVQKWCNEKGNTLCEICHQTFRPNYSAPPPLFQIGRIPLNFRGNWETPRRELQGARVIAMMSTDRSFINTQFDDSPSSRSINSCRLVALVFMVLLILRHTLPIMLNGTRDLTFPVFLLLILRTAGIVAPVLIMVRLVTAVQRRRQLREQSSSSLTLSEGEGENLQTANQIHVLDFD